MHTNFMATIETVIDGDTVTILREGCKYVIRLEHIDAPEVGEPFFKESRQFIINECWGEPCFFRCHGKEKYGRILAELVNPDTRLINAELVRNGLAYHYKMFSKSRYYEEMEKEAKKEKLNLWSDERFRRAWEDRVYRKKKYYYKYNHIIPIENYILKFVHEIPEERQVTLQQFEEFERKSQETIMQSGSIEIREITTLLEHSKQKPY